MAGTEMEGKTSEEGTMKTIPLTQGKVALVDDADYESLSAFKWFAHKKTSKNLIRYYALRNYRKSEGRARSIVSMHNQIMSAKGIDHADGDGLNNQRHNLRHATGTQNQFNRRKSQNTSSRFKGVYYYKACNKWAANIKYNYKTIFLGYFKEESEASAAYNKKAMELAGEFFRPL